MSIVTTLAQLDALYGTPVATAIVKEVDRITPHYRAKHVDPKRLPTPGQILAALSDQRVGGEQYDKAWSARAQQTLW